MATNGRVKPSDRLLIGFLVTYQWFSHVRWRQSRMSKRLSTVRRQKINNLCRTDGRQSPNFMNINDGSDLCLGLLPQMLTAYFSASLLVPVNRQVFIFL